MSIESFKQRQFFPRRFGINESRIHLYGAPKSGKSSIALYHTKQFKNPIYIDFNDFRNSLESIKNTLLKVSMEKRVDILVLDNLPEDFTSLPNIKNIITISEKQSSKFTNKEILPLSFEEFISFDKSSQNINTLLNEFIKYGNLPQSIFLKESQKEQNKQDALRLIFGDKISFALYILNLQGKVISINQIYSNLKKITKISKDFIYSFIESLQERNIIYLVPNILSQKLPKKLFLFDFSLRQVISYERDFLALFENMLFMELKRFKKPIFYAKNINLICKNKGYILAPFNTKDSIKAMLERIDLFDLEIIVLTLDLESSLKIGNKLIKIKSFINFALDE